MMESVSGNSRSIKTMMIGEKSQDDNNAGDIDNNNNNY